MTSILLYSNLNLGKYLNKLRRLLGKSDDKHRKLLLHMAQKVIRR